MRTHFVTIAISAAMTLGITAGCAEAQTKPRAVSLTSTAKPYTCTNKACQVQISVDCSVMPCVVDVDRDPLSIKGNADVSLLWKLPPGYLFCPALGDGVFLKSDTEIDDQFYDNYATDDENGRLLLNVKKAGKKNYQWKDQNTVRKSYRYKIIFRDAKCQTRFELDPTVVNEI